MPKLASLCNGTQIPLCPQLEGFFGRWSALCHSSRLTMPLSYLGGRPKIFNIKGNLAALAA